VVGFRRGKDVTREKGEGRTRQTAYQLLDAETSIGANVEEAKAAYCKREFISKNSIALKEAREEEIERLVDEANQVVAILTSTVRTARLRMAAKIRYTSNFFLLTSHFLLLSCLAS
jgi:hypothetical protein